MEQGRGKFEGQSESKFGLALLGSVRWITLGLCSTLTLAAEDVQPGLLE